MTKLDELKREHPERARLARGWTWARALRDGLLTDETCRAAWLIKGQSEPERDFQIRARLCAYSSEIVRIVDRISGAVWKRSPRRRISPGRLAGFVHCCTPDGMDMGELAQQASETTLWSRFSVALLDRGRLPGDAPAPLTAADDHTLKIDQPYVVLYEPECVLDWQLNRDGLLSYVKLVSAPYASEGRTITEYREVSSEGIHTWALVRDEKDTETVADGGFAPLAPGLAAAGRLPVAVCQFRAIDAMLARSPLTEALQAELRAFRLLSDILWDVYNAGHPWLLCWVRDALGEIGVGAAKYLKLHPGDDTLPREDARWLEMAGSALEYQFRAYAEAKREVWEKAGISPRGSAASSRGADSPSGVAIAWEFEVDEGQTLARVAQMAEDFESDLLTLAALEMGLAADWDAARGMVEISYPKGDFGLKSPERLLAQARTARDLYGADSVVFRELLKRTRGVLIDNLAPEMESQSDQEIDAMARPRWSDDFRTEPPGGGDVGAA